ncbi:hypothetical protein [Micromonospora chersina]|uniref:hypothetical protein n=1 Tax=Micromonospora chersina TaxID=47854 RepID=UPI0033F420F6
MSERSERTDGPDADGGGADRSTGRTPPAEASAEPAPPRTDAGRPGTDAGRPGTDAEELGATVAALTADDLPVARRRQLLTRLVGQARARGITDLYKPKAAIRWMTDTVTEVAPRVPIRDLATLRKHFPGLDDEALAERLVRNAARTTAGVGAAGGGVAAVEWAVTPTLLSAPVLLAAETVAVVAVELKLIGELHEVYRVPLPPGGAQRAVALVHSWATQRGINPMIPGAGVSAVLGTAARRELRDSLLRRFGRNLTTLGPFLTGAAVAGYLNRRSTRSLADQLRKDLRHQAHALPRGKRS